MNLYAPDAIRNIALVGHGDCGKTSLAEAMLYTAGAVPRLGTVQDGSTQSDFHPDEIERRTSISTSLLHAERFGLKLNILDTPGYADFTGEVKTAVHVADTVLLCFNAAGGVEIGHEVGWSYADSMHKPVVLVATKCDRETARLDELTERIRERFGHGVVPIQFAADEGAGFSTIIDVMLMKQLRYTPGAADEVEVGEIPAAHRERAEQMHQELVESVAETDEALMEKFFAEGTLSEDDLRAGLKHDLVERLLFPLVICAPATNVGVGRVMDFIFNCCPTPTDAPPIPATNPATGATGEVHADPTGFTALFVFRTTNEAHVGELAYFRVMNGHVESGHDLMNAQTNKGERLAQLFVLNGHQRKEAPKLLAGDLGAAVKLKDTHSNQTLHDKGYDIAFAPVEPPEPAVRLAVSARRKQDDDKLATGLHQLMAEDPSFTVQHDAEIHQIIVGGQGDTHLDIMLRRLRDRYGVEVDTAEPRIPYRETVRGRSDVRYRHKKQTGGAGQFAEAAIRLEPTERGSGYAFQNAVVGGVVSGKHVPAVDKGAQEMAARGVLAGYPVVDVKVTLYDGKEHPVDSNENAFKAAGRMAFKQAFLEAKPILLEPIHSVEVRVPDDHMGDVLGDLSGRRGRIQGMESEGGRSTIRAQVPLAELFGYATALRSMTQGRGVHKRSLSHYEEVPADVTERVIASAGKLHEEEV